MKVDMKVTKVNSEITTDRDDGRKRLILPSPDKRDKIRMMMSSNV